MNARCDPSDQFFQILRRIKHHRQPFQSAVSFRKDMIFSIDHDLRNTFILYIRLQNIHFFSQRVKKTLDQTNVVMMTAGFCLGKRKYIILDFLQRFLIIQRTLTVRDLQTNIRHVRPNFLILIGKQLLLWFRILFHMFHLFPFTAIIHYFPFIDNLYFLFFVKYLKLAADKKEVPHAYLHLILLYLSIILLLQR